MDNSNTDSSPVCTGTFASRGTFIGGNAVRFAARARARADPRDRVEGARDRRGRPRDRRRRGDRARARRQQDDQRRRTSRRPRRATHGELITGSGDGAEAVRRRSTTTTGEVDIEPHSAISYAACVAEVEVDDETGEVVGRRSCVQVYDVGRAINPTLVEGQIEGGAMMGLGLGLLESCVPVLPVGRAPRRAVRRLPRAGARGPAGARQRHPREPVRGRAVRRARRSARWRTTRSRPRSRPRSTTRSACGSPRCPATPERVLRGPRGEARAAPRRQARRLRRATSRSRTSRSRAERRREASCSGCVDAPSVSPFGTWNGVELVRVLRRRAGSTRSAASRCCSAACSYEPGKSGRRGTRTSTPSR